MWVRQGSKTRSRKDGATETEPGVSKHFERAELAKQSELPNKCNTFCHANITVCWVFTATLNNTRSRRKQLFPSSLFRTGLFIPLEDNHLSLWDVLSWNFLPKLLFLPQGHHFFFLMHCSNTAEISQGPSSSLYKIQETNLIPERN